jgi:serine/threonine-protein kinase ATR
MPELRGATLDTWGAFVRTLKFEDFGPFVGRTVGTLVANWTDFSEREKIKATAIIEEITANLTHFSQYLDEIVDISAIPGLEDASRRISDKRKDKPPKERLKWILERASSQNTAIATTSMKELRDFLSSNHKLISELTAGDSFDEGVPLLVRSLTHAASREGDCDLLRQYAYECFGMLGALDPHRFVAPSESPPMTIVHDFTNDDESVQFAIHLIRDVLVSAFRGTNDTKLQSHLAYAIQELLAFCGFTAKVLLPSSDVPTKVRNLWQTWPKDQLEVLAPLLESRFILGEIPYRRSEHPIYPSTSTYRDWLQVWTTDLIGFVMTENRTTAKNCKAIFGVFSGVMRNQDLFVASHLLPHLVLHVLLSGDEEAAKDVRSEIEAVLQDQVNPKGSLNKRTLSAQTIFDLMDHLSRYIRLQRNLDRAHRTSQLDSVVSIVSCMGTELMANAALQSKAYARSLRNFEERMVELRGQHRSTQELQTYFERLHHIYAELDEPDGMEGVSTFVIAPSLEHQIREHESTGRWTSAQSCWEVRLQQSPDDVTLHIGLLKCLQNLGHYGMSSMAGATHFRYAQDTYPRPAHATPRMVCKFGHVRSRGCLDHWRLGETSCAGFGR